MKRWFSRIAIVLLCVPFASAEARWCSSKLVGQPIPIYAPIARAAHVQGIVIVRAIFTPTGVVLSTEPVSGPAMLVDSMQHQIAKWRFSTNTSGDEPCQGLVIVSFGFEGKSQPATFQGPNPPDVFRFTVVVNEPVVNTEYALSNKLNRSAPK